MTAVCGDVNSDVLVVLRSHSGIKAVAGVGEESEWGQNGHGRVDATRTAVPRRHNTGDAGRLVSVCHR